MSRILKVNQSDYRLAVSSGGTITLDTGTLVGDVIVTGNLTVKGVSVTVESTNLEIKDNLILLNKGEAGPGITSVYSGIQIDRGSSGLTPDAFFVFDESVSHYDPLTSANKTGTFVLRTDGGALTGLQTNSITTAGTTDLVFDMRNSANVMKVVNSVDYYSRVTQDDHIPNKKWVTNYVDARPSPTPGEPGIAAVDHISDNPDTPNTRVQAYTSNIQFFVSETNRATITSAGLSVDKVNLFDNVITGTDVSRNLVVTSVNKNVEINAVINLDDQLVIPSTPVAGTTKIYSYATGGPGKTGLFFVNNTAVDELVAKNRALLFSMIF